MRLIPAHAGKTSAHRRQGPAGPAHPRSRGENHPLQAGTRRYHGSSPLTRGKPVQDDSAAVNDGLIPAHAGKTITWIAQLITSWAHPRSRGENSLILTGRLGGCGSSPLTRGKRTDRNFRSVHSGLIPAHAGKTHRSPTRSVPRQAHPRSRGENVQVTGAALDPKGSSPLTRGKLECCRQVDARRRLIPAHAGKTGGETRTTRSNGSSPLTRGKLQVSFYSEDCHRLIPAHAGKTSPSTASASPTPAHPRSRGENRR